MSQFSPQLAADQRLALEREIMTNQYELVEDVIFANTFFALEETGLAYPSLSPDTSEETRKLDAWLRVFASASRVREGKFFDRHNFMTWDRPQAVPRKNRVRRFADGVFGTTVDNGLQKVLDDLAAIGHLGGVIEVGKLHLRIAQPGDPYWRCESCERVHLHRGEQICTRCYARLPDNPTGAVDALWNSNFLGRRIVRGHDQGIKRFRLKCEELSGQDEDFSDRLRRIQGHLRRTIERSRPSCGRDRHVVGDDHHGGGHRHRLVADGLPSQHAAPKVQLSAARRPGRRAAVRHSPS